MTLLHKNPKYSFALLSLFGLAIMVSVLFYACKKPTDGINLLVDSEAISPGQTFITFVNVDSTSTNQPGNFTVTISGPGANLVQMVSGGTNFQASHGILPLSLLKGTVPTPSNPVVFTVSAQVPGFTPFIQNVVLTSIDPQQYVVKAADYLTAGAGVSLATKNVNINNGTATSAISLSTNTTSSMSQTATLVIPAGTKFEDANSAVINNSSSLNIDAEQFSSVLLQTADDFPGGLYSPDALQSSVNGGSAISGGVNFVPAGGVSLSMAVGSTPVKYFSNPVNLTVELSSSLPNFETGLPVAVGDVIPCWSQNDATGEWKYEGNATVFLDGSHSLAVSYPITHLSYWSFGWFWAATSTKGAKYMGCGSSLTVNLNTADPNFNGAGYTVYLESAYGNVIAYKKGGDLHNGSSVTFPSVPNIAQAKVLVKYNGSIVLVSSLFNPCSTGILSLTVPTAATALSNPVNIALNITGLCSGKQVSLLPSASFVLYQQIGNTPNFQPVGSVNIVNGVANAVLNVGVNYNLATYFNNTYYQTGSFTVTKAPFALPSSTPGFNIVSAYDATSNTVSLNGTISITCN